MAIVYLEASLKFRGGIANIRDKIRRRRWGSDTRVCRSSMSSREVKLFSLFATAFFCAVTFSFVFCTAVVNDGSSFYYLGRVGEKGCKKSGRCGVKGKNVLWRDESLER